MSQATRDIDELLALVAAGQLDALSPEEVERFETALAADDALAARLAEMPVGASDLPDVMTPTAAEWNRVWAGVERSQRRGWHLGRLVHHWQAMAAAAVIVLMVGIWELMPTNVKQAKSWQLRPDNDIQVVDLESFGDDTPVVLAGGDGDFPVIWVMEDSGA